MTASSQNLWFSHLVCGTVMNHSILGQTNCVSIHILTFNVLLHIYIKLQLQGTDPGVPWILTYIDFFKT